ncbi:hypothetical protein FOA52_013948 [Chlamydomonas sp. UWO 241]|nr:hypothetical protein FOA52_013948 [Chlamydomonas sp. UWO 241]
MPRASEAFAPDERCLGGAHAIMADYTAHFKRLGTVQPTRAILEANKSTWQTSAQTLSSNRSAKLNAIDATHVEHCRNVYYLNQRIESAYSETERKKNPYDLSMFPAYQKRASNLHRAPLHQSLCGWLPGTGRPKSAPARGKKDAAAYEGWSLTKSLRNAYPSDDFPLAETYAEVQKESVYVAYKRAIMQEIVENRMYREMDLKALFRSYKKMAPIRDKASVDIVVAALMAELDVTGKL